MEKYLAGCNSGSMIHWACWVGEDESAVDPEKPGWSPYAAMAFRFTDKELAKKAAKATPTVFNLSDSAPVIVPESEAFKPVSQMNYETIS